MPVSAPAAWNFGKVCRYWARQKPEATAINFEGTRISWLELDRLTDQLAAGLAQLGVDQGDRVGIFTTGHVEACQVAVATWKLGAVVVSLDVRLTAKQLSEAVVQAGTRILVTDATRATKLDGALHRCPEVIEVHLGRLSGLTERGGTPPTVQVDTSGPALVAYLPGPAGRPRTLHISHEEILASGAMC
jgi:acyl-CoA synthetase (AMP-forming)/AMP-acid ligase II